jgi:acyl carrier protein
LGHFKTPTRIHALDSLPKGPSGKIQRLKLQELAANISPSSAMPPTPSQSLDSADIERTIAEIWSRCLSRPDVQPHDDFFSLGGQSLLAIQCISALRQKFCVNLSLSDFFENSTVAQQTALIGKSIQTDTPTGDHSVPPLKSSDETAEFDFDLRPILLRDRSLPTPLSPNQRRIWFMEQFHRQVPVYNEGEAFRLLGLLEVDHLQKAFDVIVSRHEILRSTIHLKDGNPFMVAQEARSLPIKTIDLSVVPVESRADEVDSLLIAEQRAPYQLEREPGVRVTLLRLSPTEHILIVMMHHLICDWSSLGVLWRELSELYGLARKGLTLELPPLTFQHSDYALWQQQRLTETSLSEHLDYWEANLSGAPPLLELPTDRPRPPEMTYGGARRRFSIPERLTIELQDVCKKERVSLFTFLTATINTLLYRYSGNEDILVGIPLADRDRMETGSIIGFLLHTHVLRVQLSSDLAFSELLKLIQKKVLDLYSHRVVPFDMVVSRVRPERSLSHSPLFQAMINWRDRDQQLSYIGLEGLQIESVLTESRTSKFDLTLMLTDCQSEISLEVEYNTDIFEDDTIDRMYGHLMTILQSVVADRGQHLGDIEMLTEGERHQLAVGWNMTGLDAVH